MKMRNNSSESSVYGTSESSRVPHLFTGMAALLILTGFVFLILFCSLWRLTHYPNGGHNSRGKHIHEEEGSSKDDKKVIVIMAGHENPTFLATPAPL
ncbi:hypothetical protein SUGI_0896490 [Cryptomeria japonica]|nr:hypothetical protein SUGI_0896490 [Cryptomeria japonica]